MKEYWVNVYFHTPVMHMFKWPFKPESEYYRNKPLYRIHVKMKERVDYLSDKIIPRKVIVADLNTREFWLNN